MSEQVTPEERWQALREFLPRDSNVDILHGFIVETILPMLSADGVWVAPDPAPLNATVIEKVFADAAQWPAYKRQHLAIRSDDHRLIQLQNGVVSNDPEPGLRQECNA